MAEPSDRSSRRPSGPPRSPRKGPPPRHSRDQGRDESGPREWGSLARKGARRLGEDTRGAGTAMPTGSERDPWEPEEWIDEGPMRSAAEGAVRRGARDDRGAPTGTDVDVGAADLARAVGPARAAKVEKRLRAAADAFEHERFGEARSILAPLVDQAPGSAALRELHGLTLYRLGRWKKASVELEVFRELTGSTEQNPVLADCYRAQKRYGQVDELWEELREASPSGPLVTEGRIVMAGSLADQGRLQEAIALLEQGFKVPKRPKLHHLRRAYALADLKERAGDVPTSRSLFQRVASVDPDFADAAARARALG